MIFQLPWKLAVISTCKYISDLAQILLAIANHILEICQPVV